ncbi:YbbR-like domain-containing protein [Fervidibacillus halotolerans]|uniref:CdaR family protein n=1 Tax=Fervidibacillus halotolerans TaxID=2980027 RepID=A0A9E8RYR2_9BACI|nr:CdaR family protein [Fervidibacillus halotolerans]WAA12449.1 CdaR family protein [Fervidibacillus halotolerans]
MDKFFEKLMESKWFVRLLALTLALLLYATAYIDNQSASPTFSNNTHSETIEDVPVELYYDEENFVVTGAPATVDVHISGNYSIVQSTKNLRDFIIYLDLTEAKIGSQRVKFEIRDISDKLQVRIEPSSVIVNVQEKVTKEFSVDVEFNKGLLEEGYTTEDPIVEPSTVKVTGGKDVIEQISYVKAIIESNETIDETFKNSARVTVLDKNLNKLDVSVEPDRVEVTIPVVSPKKTVPVVIKQEGSPKEGIYIKSIEPVLKEIVIFGKKSVIEAIDQVEIPVDISEVEENTELSVPVELDEEVQGATPETIVVKIQVDKDDTREFKGIPIRVEGLDEKYEIDFISPSNGQVTLTVTGPSEKIMSLTEEDLDIFIDVDGLDEGEHEVKLAVNVPDETKWELNVDTAKIQISEKT